MATAARGLDQFPNSTPDGAVIPYDVGNVYGEYHSAVAATPSAQLDLGTDEVVGMIAMCFATVRTLLRFGTDAPDATVDTLHEDQLVIPAGSGHSILITDRQFKHMSADESSTGILYIQIYRPWKAGGVESLKQVL